jgi:chromosome segregation ATPase
VQLANAKGARSESGKDMADLRARLEEATAEKQRNASKLASVEEDRRSLQEQLQDVRFFACQRRGAELCIQAKLQPPASLDAS